MAERELSVLRALNEISLLNKKIEKNLSVSEKYTSVEIGEGNVPSGFKSRAEAEQSIKSAYQSMADHISRRERIKAAIVQSNAVTMVNIGGRTLTVASAVELKTSIKYKVAFLTRMRDSYVRNILQVESQNNNLEKAIEVAVNAAFGGKTAKIGKEEYEAIASPMRKDKLSKLFDPIDIKTKIDALEKEIDEFNMNIDNVLTESNAITKITFED